MTLNVDYSSWKPATDSTLDLRLGTRHDVKEDDAFITDVAAQMSDKLKVIETQGSFISQKGLQAIATQCPNVERLNFCCAHAVDDKALEIISQFSNLKELNLDFARNEAHVLQFLGPNCRVIPGCLSSVEKITDAGVKRIVESCTQLQALDLSGTDITQATLDLINATPNITLLRIHSCWNLTQLQIEAFTKSARPTLQIVATREGDATDEFIKLVRGVHDRFYSQIQHPDRSISLCFQPGVDQAIKPFVNLEVLMN